MREHICYFLGYLKKGLINSNFLFIFNLCGFFPVGIGFFEFHHGEFKNGWRLLPQTLMQGFYN